MKRNKFGSIRQLPSGRFQVRYYKEPGLSVTARTIDDRPLTFTSRELARKYLLHLESDLIRGVSPYEKKKIQSYTLRKRVEMYLDASSGSRLTANPLRASTAANYRRLADSYLFRKLGQFCLAEMDISEIKSGDVRRWHSLIQSQCVVTEREVKSKAHPARTWGKENGLEVSNQGKLDPKITDAWIQAGAPIIKRYRKNHDGIVQLAQAYRFLRAVLNVAIEDELITSNPCRIKGAGQPHHPERPIATITEVAALANEVPPRYRAVVLLATFTSLRSSELLGLQRKHINELKRSLTIEHQLNNYASDSMRFVPTKTNASNRSVIIPSNLMADLIQHLESFTDADPESLVFTTSNGLPLYRGRKSWFITAKRRLNLDHLHFHDLRHTGQTLAMEKGASIKDLQRRAGQSTERAASIYLHGSKTRDGIVAESLADDVSKTLNQMRKLVNQ
jgi:integrase